MPDLPQRDIDKPSNTHTHTHAVTFTVSRVKISRICRSASSGTSPLRPWFSWSAFAVSSELSSPRLTASETWAQVYSRSTLYEQTTPVVVEINDTVAKAMFSDGMLYLLARLLL